MRNDVIKMYREIHSWVGIICGLCLFIAFYAGAITMFEKPLQRWASAPLAEAAITPLDKAPQLIDKVLAEYPEAAKGYQVILHPGPEQPGRLYWETRVPNGDDHTPPIENYANLTAEGELVVTNSGPSEVAELIDVLHQQIGLPFDHEIAMPIVGIISLLYGIALVSGIFVLFPTLVKDLFALRIGKNLKRMWLDLHNVLGLFSLPFHIVIALTSVVFALHDQFYDAQRALIYPTVATEGSIQGLPQAEPKVDRERFLTPAQVVSRVSKQAPDYQLKSLNYGVSWDNRFQLQAMGVDPRYGSRGPREGFAGVDPYTGEIIATDFMPGRQPALTATLSSFFALHFGNYGGNFVRWCYFLLGLAGAFLFYSGNLLWLESRRKKRRKALSDQEIKQTKAAKVLGALTVAVPLGCVAGISLIIAAAKVCPQLIEQSFPAGFTGLYYSVFVISIVWAFNRGAARAAVDLLRFAALVTLLMPVVSVMSWLLPSVGWNHADTSMAVDLVALGGSAVLFFLAGKTAKRIRRAPTDSLWYIGENPHTHLVIKTAKS